MLHFLAALQRLFFRPKSVAWVSENGAQLLGLPLFYKGSEALPYGRVATQRQRGPEALIIHHPAAAKGASIHDLIRFINRPRRDGNMYGYHFLIDRDGTIYQTAPLNKRTNHIKPPGSKRRRAFGRVAHNANTLGICFHLASHNPHMAPTPSQQAAGMRLVKALQHIYGPLPTYGHGEIQTDKQPDEGRVFAQTIRRKFPL